MDLLPGQLWQFENWSGFVFQFADVTLFFFCWLFWFLFPSIRSLRTPFGSLHFAVVLCVAQHLLPLSDHVEVKLGEDWGEAEEGQYAKERWLHQTTTASGKYSTEVHCIHQRKETGGFLFWLHRPKSVIHRLGCKHISLYSPNAAQKHYSLTQLLHRVATVYFWLEKHCSSQIHANKVVLSKYSSVREC